MKVFLFGYPGDYGGACTEVWHVVRLWKSIGIDFALIPTWSPCEKWLAECNRLGIETIVSSPESLHTVDGLENGIAVSFCNDRYLAVFGQLKEMGCKNVWANCMTFLFEKEKEVFASFGLPDAFIWQSLFQKAEIEPQLTGFGYKPSMSFLIRGALDKEAIPFRFKARRSSEPFVFGRMARADQDKWSSNTWPIYSAVQFENKRAIVLGVDENTKQKLGKEPSFCQCLKPNAIPVSDYLSLLHCLVPVNGGARENWPRAGLEAMAAGVPIVTQNAWGWKEMIVHGETGFLANNDCELSHFTACLAYDESLRLKIAENAYESLSSNLASPSVIGKAWTNLFESLA